LGLGGSRQSGASAGEGEEGEAAALEAKKQIALERYQAVVGSDGERLVSGSDDFTLFMWQPTQNRTPMTRMVVSSCGVCLR
jgi:ribosome assembly protein 4